MSINESWHWRNSMRPVRFFMFDARAIIPWLLVLVHARLGTLILAFIVTMIFYAVEKRGLVVPAALRAMRVWLLGPTRPAVISVHKRKFQDYGM